MSRIKDQAQKLGADVREIVEIADVRIDDQTKMVVTDEGEFRAGALIVATGREPIRLPVETDCDRIHYCAVCDGAAYRNKDVLVVGGGNSGVGDALYLLNQGVRNVFLVEQAECLFASRTAQEALSERSEVSVRTCTEVESITLEGETILAGLRHTKSGKRHTVSVSGIFVYIGQAPQTDMFRDLLRIDEQGYIIGDEDMKTNVEGVFVAGDVRRKKYRQLTTAMNDGTIAALSSEAYLRSRKTAGV